MMSVFLCEYLPSYISSDPVSVKTFCLLKRHWFVFFCFESSLYVLGNNALTGYTIVNVFPIRVIYLFILWQCLSQSRSFKFWWNLVYWFVLLGLIQSQGFLLLFSSRSSIVLDWPLSLWSTLSTFLCMMCGVWIKVQFFWHMNSQLFQHYLLKRLFLLH